jgi:mannose-1-phosphate guanylyltransferase
MANIQIIALGGGSGTRFWPVSRRAHPKQLLRLGGDASLLAATFERVRSLSPPDWWWMVVGAGHAEACRAAAPDVPANQVLVEPLARNTAPAIGLAAVHLAHRGDATMAVLPADHAVGRPDAFAAALSTAAQAAESGAIVTLGIDPTRAETGYGYIQRGPPHEDGTCRVAQFVEKPDRANAERMLEMGGYYWNAGVFVMRASTYLAELERHLPAVHGELQKIGAAIGDPSYNEVLAESYEAMTAVSIDYGVMEHASNVSVVPVACDWTDVGSWNAIEKLLTADDSGNCVQGRAVLRDSKDCVVYSSDGHVVAAVGMEGVVVVHTADATLVVPASRAQEVREVIATLQAEDWSEYL